MDQPLFDTDTKQLWSILANPADKMQHVDALKRLALKYPYSNLLHALSARAGNKELIKKAAVYFNNSALYRLVKVQEPSPVVEPGQIISLDKDGIVGKILAEPVASPQTEAINESGIPEVVNFEENPPAPDHHLEAEAQASVNEAVETVEPGLSNFEENPPATDHRSEAEAQASVNEAVETVEPGLSNFEENPPATDHHLEAEAQALANQIADDANPGLYDFIQEPVAPVTSLAEEVPVIAIAQPQAQLPSHNTINEEKPFDWKSLNYEDPAAASEEIQKPGNTDHEEEIFEEITGIEDFFTHAATPAIAPALPAAGAEPVDYSPAAESKEEQPILSPKIENGFAEPVYHPYIEETQQEIVAREEPVINNREEAHDKFNLDDEIVSNIVATDFLGFESALIKDAPQQAAAPKPVPAATPAANTITVAEEQQTVAKYHDDSLPYSFLWWLDKTRRDHSNIYQPYAKAAALPNLSTITEHKQAQQPVVEARHKEEAIIERFIQEEPHIKPPSSDKLDNENKAKTSAEDSDELVTETLARIYTDQMLFHKAIATYKKLILRFPEKSTYFAGQIQSLEKRIN